MSGIKFSFGVADQSAKASGSSKSTRTSIKRPLASKAFDEDEEDDEDDEQAWDPKAKGKTPAHPRSGPGALLLPPTTSKLSRQQKLKQEEAARVDATVFEYDEVYDDMKQAERQSKMAKDQSGAQRKVSHTFLRPMTSHRTMLNSRTAIFGFTT